MGNVRFLPVGDTALSVEFPGGISPETNSALRALGAAIQKNALPGIRELVPSYRALMVHYDPAIIKFDALAGAMEQLLQNLDETALPQGMVVELPVLYGGEGGPDLSFVAEHAGLTPNEVVALHTEPEYLVYMLGFTPGFPYLGGMDARIATPRLQTPRLKIPGGSVGIAGLQTGVYPLDSPGGWQLIGHTPVRLYDPLREEPFLLSAGDFVRFCPVEKPEYDKIAAAVAAGGYECRRTPKKEAAI